MIADVTAVTESVAEEKEGSTSVSSTTITSSSIHSSVHSKSAVKSPKSYNLTNESTSTSPKYDTSAWCHNSQNQYESDNFMDDEHTSESKNSENVEAKLNESLLDQDVNVLLKHPSSSDFKSSKSHLTSEVDVSFKDLEPLSDTSYTAAFKTSPTQISDDRCSRLSTVSTSSYFAKNPDVNMFYSPQIPIEHKPEKVVEKIKKQFEPFKTAAEEEAEYLPETNALKSKYDEVIPKSSPLKVPRSPINIFESVGEESQEEIDDYIYGEFDEMVTEEEGEYLPRLLSPISEHYSAESGTGSSSFCSISQLSVHTAIEREYADVEEEDSRGESGSPTSFREYWRDAGELAERCES
uniref:Uncharacterized protein n=1 Tax=Panagrolaimus superbus TaxID=310955 RepID=A0A914Z7M5_9BILA